SARQGGDAERTGTVVHGLVVGRRRDGDAVRGERLRRSLLPHGPGQRHRQPDPARDQAVREPAHRAHDERAHRRRRHRHHPQGDQHGPGGRQAARDDVPYRERPADGGRSPRPPGARPHAPLRERVMQRALLLLVFLALPAFAAEVAGVQVDERAKVESSDLVLNGAGLRTKYFLSIYVAGLYLTEKKTSPADVLALPGA